MFQKKSKSAVSRNTTIPKVILLLLGLIGAIHIGIKVNNMEMGKPSIANTEYRKEVFE